MISIILCGGQSTRMGSDKGMLPSDTSTWAQSAADKMALLQLPIVLSVNNNQYNDYSTLFNPKQLIKDDESLQIKGPLAGVLSVHHQHPSEDLFVFACDMPLMEPVILKELYKYYINNPGYQAYLYINDKEAEPLCAIYRKEGLSSIIEIHQKGNLVKHSMKFMLGLLSVYSIPVEENQKKYFRNINAHAEVNGL
ncbi:MAG: molybdenum cofactor guanylyltransferase [Bacteroidia bacterium]|nr:molybdenum cofactor guanylyltransferase [Bacteroidia bacterium]